MEEKVTLIETLVEKATDYGKASYQLAKLKTLDKTSDVVSSMIPRAVVFFLVVAFLMFASLGLADWLGELLGRPYFGYFIVSGFYGLVGIFMHFFMHNYLKTIISNYIIQLVLK